MSNRVKSIPDAYRMVVPHLIVKGASQAIDFYKRAFGAEEISRAPGPDGQTIMHADLKLGESRIFLADEVPQMNCRGP